MIDRTSKILHKRSGISVETPMLIPSFSSKGFSIGAKGKAEIEKLFQYASEFITTSCLISAYDVHYGFIPSPDTFPFNVELVFLDSGGYEVSEEQDKSEVLHMRSSASSWTSKNHKSVLDKWPNEIPAVFVSYDHPRHKHPFAEQVERSTKLFRAYPEQLHLFLIKPERQGQYDIEETLKTAKANIDKLSSFDIIGMTEKELGSSMLARMKNLAEFRLALDRQGISSPIHVFGALDPISIFLYFIAGAEIFDGLTWLRYAYSEGRCVYMHNHGALSYGLHVSDNQLRLRCMTENIYTLSMLEHKMREYHATRDLSKLGNQSGLVSSAIDSLKTELGGQI